MLIEQNLYTAVNVSHENIFFALCDVDRHPNREFLALSGKQVCAENFEEAESRMTKTGNI